MGDRTSKRVKIEAPSNVSLARCAFVALLVNRNKVEEDTLRVYCNEPIHYDVIANELLD